MRRIFIYFVLFSMCSVGISDAQTPTLAEDIVPGSNGSGPNALINFNGKICFTADDGTHGIELWGKVGASPSAMVSDYWYGSGGGVQPYGRKPMIVYNNRLYYDGMDSFGVRSLMSYDGVNPPAPVPYPLLGSGYPIRNLTVLNNKLYFTADSGTKYGSIFEYTVAGGVKLLATPGNVIKGVYSDCTMIDYKGKLYFSKDSSGFQQELYSLDPATLVVKRVTDIRPGPKGSYPTMFVVGRGKLYFTADDSAHGYELYSFDGVTAKRETDIVTGTGKSIDPNGAGSFRSMVYHKGGVFFVGVTSTANYVVYRFDTLTKAVTSINNFGSLYPDIQTWHSTGTNLYFAAKTAAEGKELWRYDGKVCKMVADLNPGNGDGAFSSTMVPYLGGLLFSGNDGTTGPELYHIMDNTAAGIQNLNWNGTVNIYPNPATTSATLKLQLDVRESICISLTNSVGQEVYNSGLQSFNAGIQTKEIPVQSFVPGQYFYRLTGQSGQLLASGALVRQ